MKKMLTLVLCLAILLSLAVGAVPAAKADHSEQVKLTVAYNKKGTDALPNSILDQILLEKFNIVVEWKDLEDRDFKTNMTLQMAGKDYPDIIWHSDNGTAQELSLTGHILAIDDYEDKLPDYIKIFDEGVDTQHLQGLEGEREVQQDALGGGNPSEDHQRHQRCGGA